MLNLIAVLNSFLAIVNLFLVIFIGLRIIPKLSGNFLYSMIPGIGLGFLLTFLTINFDSFSNNLYHNPRTPNLMCMTEGFCLFMAIILYYLFESRCQKAKKWPKILAAFAFGTAVPFCLLLFA